MFVMVSENSGKDRVLAGIWSDMGNKAWNSFIPFLGRKLEFKTCSYCLARTMISWWSYHQLGNKLLTEPPLGWGWRPVVCLGLDLDFESRNCQQPEAQEAVKCLPWGPVHLSWEGPWEEAFGPHGPLLSLLYEIRFVKWPLIFWEDEACQLIPSSKVPLTMSCLYGVLCCPESCGEPAAI